MGTAASITGQGSFATLSAITSALANANNLLRFTSGGLFSGELTADTTASHTAASFTGQGAFATLSAVNSTNWFSYFTNGAVQQAGLAGNAVRLGTNIVQSNGSTLLTDALAVTSLGTAASITGQGSFATLSAISTALANTNNLLRFTSGGLFSGELTADTTAAHTAASITG